MSPQTDTGETLLLTTYSDPVSKIREDVSTLPDEEVLRLSHLKMSIEQGDYLQSKRKEEELSQTEETELAELMQIYCLGLLHKSQGLAEAVRRGLREPLHP
jgi:hypothetical protein